MPGMGARGRVRRREIGRVVSASAGMVTIVVVFVVAWWALYRLGVAGLGW